ncbi:inositol monophosphatase family protein [Thioclava sp. BHET1]|nr:inositol monophosphatase family protein [Thioclava sp. BHET1]
MPAHEPHGQGAHCRTKVLSLGSATANLHDRLCDLLKLIAQEVFAQGYEVEAKGETGLDFVTSIDFAIQARLKTELESLLPGSVVLGEEGYAEMTTPARQVWLVDPLDGTVNFVAGLPSFAIAVVLIEEGAPVLSAVRDIPHETTYSAIAGGGAFVNGSPLRRQEHGARLAVLSSGLLADLAARNPAQLVELLKAYKLRNFGSQALHLCYAAAGKLSLVASREAKGWDDLAGALIAREAGLRYGHYGHPPATLDADQRSLCTSDELFAPIAERLGSLQP